MLTIRKRRGYPVIKGNKPKIKTNIAWIVSALMTKYFLPYIGILEGIISPESIEPKGVPEITNPIIP